MGEFGVSDKEPNKNSITTATTTSTSVKRMMMMMVHHNHHHRPLSPPFDGDGPTIPQYTSLTDHHHNISPAAVASAPLGAIDGAPAAVRPLQPFDISPYSCSSATTTTPPSSSAFVSSGMAASSLGFFPFTSAQWKELERQAMIYKYMMASVPVPPDLLLPIASSRSPLDGGFNLRLSSSGSSDPEPGRCKRTDGKKWRCSRDVAPNHKYCERHMHRGRPRSRKPVEVHTNNNISNNNGQQHMKRARHGSDPFANSGVTVAISNPTTRRKDGPSSHSLGSHAAQPYLESSLSLDNFGVKGASFGSLASSKEPRGLDWMLNGDPISLGASDSEWHSLMHNNKVGLNAMSSCSDTESHYLNSFALYGSALDQDQHNRCPPMFLNPLVVPMEESLQSEKPRGFIDAWGAEENNADNKNNVSTIGKLSLSSLDLSMGSGYMHEDHMGGNEMGLCLMEHDGNNNNTTTTTTTTHNHHGDTKGNNLSNWLTPSSTPGGPLAEVLRPSAVTASSNSNPSSPAMTANAESNSRTMVSSPSGVLHKTLASLSDSSGNSSPTVASSSGPNSEVALLRFNHMSN